jgi:hypothetical protein
LQDELVFDEILEGLELYAHRFDDAIERARLFARSAQEVARGVLFVNTSARLADFTGGPDSICERTYSLSALMGMLEAPLVVVQSTDGPIVTHDGLLCSSGCEKPVEGTRYSLWVPPAYRSTIHLSELLGPSLGQRPPDYGLSVPAKTYREQVLPVLRDGIGFTSQDPSLATGRNWLNPAPEWLYARNIVPWRTN